MLVFLSILNYLRTQSIIPSDVLGGINFLPTCDACSFKLLFHINAAFTLALGIFQDSLLEFLEAYEMNILCVAYQIVWKLNKSSGVKGQGSAKVALEQGS